MSKVIKKKVLVYCVNEGKLLVFRHTAYTAEELGVQVPAGSIRAGEAPREAALRELVEETGYSCFEIEDFLGTSLYDISPYRMELQERYFFRARTTEPLPDRWMSQEDHDGEQPPTQFECFWVALEAAHLLQSGQGSMLWRLVDDG